MKTGEPDRTTWHARSCPRRKQIIGPHSKFVADKVQHSFELVQRNDRLHLVHADGADRTLCGEPAAGEMIPFLAMTTRTNPKIRQSPRLATFMPSGAMVLFVSIAFCTIRR
jgi:hypothetical protein